MRPNGGPGGRPTVVRTGTRPTVAAHNPAVDMMERWQAEDDARAAAVEAREAAVAAAEQDSDLF